MQKIVILDYGLGNLGSVYNMLKHIDVISEISKDHAVIEEADKLILPGVGSFDHGMQNIHESKLEELLNFKVKEQKVPVLGICLGMQLLGNGSEEGDLKGLGWIDASCKKFQFDDPALKIPHMGWNYVYESKNHTILNDFGDNPKFYFVHSYYMKCSNPVDELLKCNYGFDFTCAVQKDNIFGFQFHPEKSHKYGMQLFKNFAAI
jgi:glutamine amidotransferase